MSKCKVCQHAKGRSHNIRFYSPFPIPDSPWDLVRMDFVLGLPRTQKGNDFILVVVDKFNKITHFIPSYKTSDDTRVANLFFKEVVSLEWISKKHNFRQRYKIHWTFLENSMEEVGNQIKFQLNLSPIDRWEN